MSVTNLILVGNGFDLAHGLSTRYSDFIAATNEKEFHEFTETILRPSGTKVLSKTKVNKLYKNIVAEKGELWSDIESIYFENLIKSSESKYINEDFKIIKNLLLKYLEEHNKKTKRLELYNYFFSKFQNPIAVSFNYTETIYHYIEYFDRLILLHGRLDDNSNPTIFGYAADNEATSSLLSKGKGFLRYIKQYEYLGANNYKNVLRILEATTGRINIHLLGLSCGQSDKQILNSLFTNKKVETIFNYYFESREDHLEKLININRIVPEEIGFLKYISFPDSLRMIQHSDDIEITKKIIDLFFDKNQIRINAPRPVNPLF